MVKCVVRSRRVVLPDGERPASIHIEDGVIVRVGPFDDSQVDVDVVDAGDLIVSPGLVDSHVHVNEPGRTDWEGFDTATRAAAAGGVTTIVDMPLNSVPATIDVAALDAKRRAADGRCHVDVAFWGGIVPGNEGEIPGLVAAGVRGFKAFLVPSGVAEFACVAEADLRRALPVLAQTAGKNRPLLVHAEHPALIEPLESATREYAAYLRTRPATAEASAVDLIAMLTHEYDVATHIVHLSSAGAVKIVESARRKGLTMSAETCPHYLTFAAPEIPDGATPFKCAPPIRSASDRDALWDALRRGTCSLVASDHSPAPASMKALDTGDFAAAWGGIASLELSLSAAWTGARARGFVPADLARWMSEGPARLAGLSQKGAIVEGHDADLVIWDPDRSTRIDAVRLEQRHKTTPYEGRVLFGAVRETWLRGRRIWHEDRLLQERSGVLL